MWSSATSEGRSYFKGLSIVMGLLTRSIGPTFQRLLGFLLLFLGVGPPCLIPLLHQLVGLAEVGPCYATS